MSNISRVTNDITNRLTVSLFTSLSVLFFSCQQANSAEVVMAFAEEIRPYVIPTSNSGIELAVIGESLAYHGHKLIPKYYPLGRLPKAFIARKVDAAMTDAGINLSAQGYYAEPTVIYHNRLISLKKRNLKIAKPEDLTGLSVIAFKGADQRYPRWLDAVKKEGKYYATSKQNLQVRMLFAGRYDVVLSDRYIFNYYANQLIDKNQLQAHSIQEHNVFKLNPENYRPIFRNKTIRDDFNEGLNYLKQTGRYQAIYDYYLTSRK
ncbi:MAG: polar amino acid transport system substrate-binding protein [Psychromonas sp.]|jgi:polar amino acid transport system substrate-binding protein|uniref:substrate-binding periplasmic protein n=1 Tax=Psychromonas sp. TaxID=1884585 RepID=UPI0039E5A754